MNSTLWVLVVLVGIVLLAIVGLLVLSGVEARPEGETAFSAQDAVPEPMAPLGQDTTDDSSPDYAGLTDTDDLYLTGWDARDLTVTIPTIVNGELNALHTLVFRTEEQQLVAHFKGEPQIILQYDPETGWSVESEAGHDPE